MMVGNSLDTTQLPEPLRVLPVTPASAYAMAHSAREGGDWRVIDTELWEMYFMSSVYPFKLGNSET